MNMPKFLKTLVLLVGLVIFGANAFAAPVVRCANCSAAAMEQKARQQGPGTWDIWVPTTGALGRFKVLCNVQPQGGGGVSDAPANARSNDTQACSNQITDYPPIPIDRSEAAYKFSQIHNGTGGTMKVGVVVRQRDIPNTGYSDRSAIAHDYLTDFYLRGRMNDGLTNNSITNASSPLYAIVVWLLAHADSALGFTDALEMLVTVEFDDGSEIKVVVTLTRGAEYVRDSARDSGGNPLPEENAPRYTGTWRFNNEQNPGQFRRLIERLGGEFIGQGTFVWVTDIYDCSWNGERLTCTLRRQNP